ncbi:archaeosortase/exosortase family protein [archaeon]|nr:archaeosortase/exosortase family protein [archaeon]
MQRFFLVFVLLYLFFLIPEFSKAMGFAFPDFLFPLKVIVASGANFLLGLIGVNVFLSGLTLTLLGGTLINFTIVSSCTGVVSYSIFAGLLYATPLKNKLLYALLGLPLFVLWNVLRVTLTLSFGRGLIESLHNGFWFLSIILVMGVYLVILKREKVSLSEEKW